MKNFTNLKETDLYKPIYKYFKNLGFNINAEVSGFDVVLTRDDLIYIVEIKLNFNIKLLKQAIEAQKVANFVYVAIPLPKRQKGFNSTIHIAKSLGLGLIIVGKTVQVVLEPEKSLLNKNYRKIKKVKHEVDNRKVDINVGGSNRKKINTVYREKSIQIACHLENKEFSSAKELVKEGCPQETLQILYNNFFGYFERIGRGKYTLSHTGKKMLQENEFEKVVNYYRKHCKKEQDK
ncbi:MAG: DUF2161 family putative PD-(D/E)XK-type phosphodiesterase [Defluviitaleaceae bacterium]|nr:DUF2161 family putative PD-(D/E)XK-type phosphodiesterase [Defluviitaleaceae bacterium]